MNLRFLFILVLSFTLLSACKPQGASVTPDGARQILQLRGFSPDAKGYFEAIRTEDLAAIRTFFQSDLDLNMTNEKGDTPLTYAIGYCELKTIKILADKVDLNAHDRNGDTALFLAYKDRRHDVFDFLLERGADVNARVHRNYTLLHMAAGDDDDALIKRLVEHGADVNAVSDYSGEIPFNQSCIGRPAQLEAIGYFLDKGADINHPSNNGKTCLMYVAQEGYKELVEELLRRGANQKIKDSEGKTARDHALKHQHQEVAELLK